MVDPGTAIVRAFTDYDENVVDQLDKVAKAGAMIANAITDQQASPGRDESGGPVGCLTEAVMGMTTALGRIADALDGIAAAIYNRR